MFTIRHRTPVRIRRGVMTAATTLLVASATLSVAAPQAHAAATTIAVNNPNDDGSASSLRAVISSIAGGSDTIIQLHGGTTYVINRLCQNGDPDDNHGGDLDLITDADVRIEVRSPGTATLMVACAGERILDHIGTGELEFRNVRLTGGNTAKGANGVQAGNRNAMSAQPGGAVRSLGTLGLFHVSVDGNRTGDGGNGAPALFSGVGGAGGHGGGGAAIKANVIWAYLSVIADNTSGTGGNGANGIGAGNAGGAGGSGGNGTLAASKVTLTRTEIEGNHLGNGGVGGIGLGALAAGGSGGHGGSGGGVFTTDLQLDASTVTNNRAGTGATGGKGNGTMGGTGGSGGRGGGVWAEAGAISRSTIHANAAGSAGPGGVGTPNGAVGLPGTGGGLRVVVGPGIAISWSTITANSAPVSSNIESPAAITSIQASVVGEGVASASCAAPLTDLGATVHDDASCTAATPSIPALGLGPIGANGGPTTTRLPLLGGPLAELIPAAACDALVTLRYDQRDESRPNGNCEPGAVELPPIGASAFTALSPARVFDTRVAGTSAGFVAADSVRTVQFAGVAGVPVAGVTAVAFNLTLTESGGAGYVTAYPAGSARPLASSLNTVRAGQTVPNLVVVPLDPSGQVSFYAQSGGHLLADVVGYYTSSAISTAGRTIALTPARLFDTREPGPVAGKVAVGATVAVAVTGHGGVPATGVSAVVLNVTATDADAAGFVTVHPGGVARPLASTLNLSGAGDTTANLTIVPVGADGTVSFYSQSGAHLLADVTGYITDASAPLATEGLFVPRGPIRLFDTRNGDGLVGSGTTLDVATAGQAMIPADAAAVVINLTATEAVAPGYITAYPTGEAQPLASSLNLTSAGETRANAALVPIGTAASTSYFSQSGAQLVADWFGYLLPAPPPLYYAIGTGLG
jgi:hypothetical protein